MNGILENYNKLNEQGRALAQEAVRDIASNKRNLRKHETPREKFDRETRQVLAMCHGSRCGEREE